MKISTDYYYKGKSKLINEMIAFVKKEIASIKAQNVEPNSNRQITNGGRLLAYNKVLTKLLVKKEKIELHE